MSTGCCISLRNISFARNTNGSISNIDLNILKGQLAIIISFNQSVLNNLVKLLRGEEKPDEGEVVYLGVDRNDILFLPKFDEENEHYPVTVFNLVKFASFNCSELSNKSGVHVKSLVNEAIAKVGMSHYAKCYIHELSLSQIQRVRFARIILQNPKVLILDRPFLKVNSKTKKDLLDLLKDMLAKNMTIVVTNNTLDDFKNIHSQLTFIHEGVVFTKALLTPSYTHFIKG
ncbi:ATP-binding cassette domain-containing protein [Pseudoalteromonas sp. DL-6]|uniref:ATP-binding cassette domain-containing protein n=1 Tax=Pseudoalteromonas sp. DL-6 TaxID=1390185 RepID=UPI00103C274A|nr:ATP-binding cassette domain-containing protein [Pseudoalteromonas sp. DL-6]QBJ63645.1 hypothetical protein B1F84_11695 [Pseudoalteromonas sp. DL-6]